MHLLDFPNISIRASELQLPFQAALKVEKIGDMILKATEPQMVLFNLYDEWLKSISSYTAFSRMVLVLRALHVNIDKTKLILRPDKTVITKDHHIWPTLSEDDWMKVEMQLRDLVLNDYGKKNNVNVSSLTQNEVRDIILGMEISAPSLQRQQAAEIDKQDDEQRQLTAVTTKTISSTGQEMIVTTTSKYEQTQFQSKTEWRSRALAALNLRSRVDNVYVLSDDVKTTGRFTYIMPKNLYEQFIKLADLRVEVVAYLYGSSPPDNARIKEIKCLAMVPQIGSIRDVQLPQSLPESDLLVGMEPLGLIHTYAGALPQFMTAYEMTVHGRLASQHPKQWKPDNTVTVTAALVPGAIQLTAWEPTEAGLAWGAQNKDMSSERPAGFDPEQFSSRCQLLLTDKLRGFFVVPVDDLWNYTFIGAAFDLVAKRPLLCKIERPLSFYDAEHRPIHFKNFGAVEDIWVDREDPFA